MCWTFSNLMAYAIFCLWKKRNMKKSAVAVCERCPQRLRQPIKCFFLQQQQLYIIKLGKSNLPLLHSANVFK